MSDITTRPRHRINFQLWLGAALVLIILLISVWGPSWAPHDPLQAYPIIKLGDTWVAAPHPPLKYEMFPLGTDTGGRDILSQSLWAVRPTMILVSIVAVVRMLMGLLIGLTAGWLSGFPGRLLNNIIAAAVAAPVLIVALAVIAAVGVDLGVTAFILGLAATGWAETARLVSERTRSIRSMPYIEAARSLGQSTVGLLTSHVLRQIAPLVWMLFAFEVSGTLLTSASLGFLGYYIGGEVWTPVTDTSSIRTSGMPELGLMVATLSSDIFTGPYKMAAAGTLIFITILGFNLLGEGLRLRLEQGSPRLSQLVLFQEQAALWLDHHLWYPFTSALRRSKILSAGLSLLLFLLIALAGWGLLRPASPGVIPAGLHIPGDHFWASQYHDPYSTGQTGTLGPQESPAVLWTKHMEGGGYSGGPVIAADGTLYLTSDTGQLSAFTSSGTMLWRIFGDTPFVGSPALSEEGRIYATGASGELMAYSPAGRVLWHVLPEEGTTPTASAPATSGPVVGRNGTIYYMRAGMLQAVSPQGHSLWLSQARSTRTASPPGLSPDGVLVFALDAVLRSSDGEKLTFSTLAGSDQYITGADSRLYARLGNELVEWRSRGAGEALIVRRLEWDYHAYGLISPASQMGATAASQLWLLFYSEFEDGHVIWLDDTGSVTGEVRFPHRQTRAIGVDGSSILYICGTNRMTSTAECLALSPDRNEPLWTVPLPYGSRVAGGAVGPGVLYVTTADGYLMSLGMQTAP